MIAQTKTLTSKHDSWVTLKPNSPFSHIEFLFPEGFPVRDPFPMSTGNNGTIALWDIDLDRLGYSQITAIAKLIAQKCQVDISRVIAEAQAKEGFGLSHQWVNQLWCGAEGISRHAELEEFFDRGGSLMDFFEQQRKDWINGDRQPDILITAHQLFANQDLQITVVKLQDSHEHN